MNWVMLWKEICFQYDVCGPFYGFKEIKCQLFCWLHSQSTSGLLYGWRWFFCFLFHHLYLSKQLKSRSKCLVGHLDQVLKLCKSNLAFSHICLVLVPPMNRLRYIHLIYLSYHQIYFINILLKCIRRSHQGVEENDLGSQTIFWAWFKKSWGY